MVGTVVTLRRNIRKAGLSRSRQTLGDCVKTASVGPPRRRLVCRPSPLTSPLPSFPPRSLLPPPPLSPMCVLTTLLHLSRKVHVEPSVDVFVWPLNIEQRRAATAVYRPRSPLVAPPESSDVESTTCKRLIQY